MEYRRKKVKTFLLFEEEKEIIKAYTKWRETNETSESPETFLIFLHDHDALSLDKCREIIRKPEPIMNEITIDDFKRIVMESKKQKAVLQSIVDNITEHLTVWGNNGRLIDRDYVFACFYNIKNDAEKVLNEVGKNGGA